MSKFWENDPLADEAPATGPQPIYTAPDPAGAEQRTYDRNQDTISNQRDAAGEARAARSEARAIDDGAFDRVGKLRTEFNSLPDVKAFREVKVTADQIVTLAESGSAMADIGLVTSFMKALDPGSTVREGEFATAQNASGVPGQIRNAYNQLIDGKRLNDTQRADMAKVAQGLLASRAGSYNQLAEVYSGLLQEEGADPAKHGVSLFEIPAPSQEAKNPTTQDVYAEGVNWTADNPETVFDRSQYLRDQYGIGDGDEALIIGFTRANRGRNITADQIAQFYNQNNLPLPDAAQLEEMAQGIRDGAEFAGIDTSEAEAQYRAGLEQYNQRTGEGDYGMGELATQGAAFGLADEALGIGEAAKALLAGRNPVAGYQVGRDAARLGLEQAREREGGMGTAAELAGGLVTGGIRMAPAIGRTVNVARGARSAAPVASTAAREGAAAGGVAGFGYGEGLEGSAAGTAVGAATGAVGGKAIEKAIPAVARALPGKRGLTPEQVQGRQVVRSADRLNDQFGTNLQPMPADVGGATVRRATSGAAQTTFGAAHIVNAGKNLTEQAQVVAEKVAAREGTALTPQGAGEKAIAGAGKTIKTLGTKVDAKYAEARRLAGDTRVPLPNAQQALAGHVAELADTPGGAKGAAYLRELMGEIDGEWTPDGIRRMRKELRDRFIKDDIRGTDLERRVTDVIVAAEDDIQQGLRAAGQADAAEAYRVASETAAERFDIIDNVLTPIIGKKGDQSAEAAFKKLNALAGGDAATLGRFMKALPPEEAGAVRATIISRLGRATKGQQDETGEAFSLSRFLTNWNDEGLSPTAKSAMFDGETRAALNNLARVARGTKEAQGYANFSNSGGANAFNALVTGGPVLAGNFASPTAAAAGAGLAVSAQMISGRLLASPKFTRWLVKLPKQTTPAAVRNHAKGLNKIAASDAAVSAEIIDFQEALLNQLTAGPQRAAADDPEMQDEAQTTTGPGTR